MTIFIIIGLIILVIWLVNYQATINSEEKIRQVSGELRVKYPNFVRAVRQSYQNNAVLYADNDKALCYKVPVKSLGIHKGDLYYSIIDTTNIGNKPYIIKVYKGIDGIEINTERFYMSSENDLTIEEYIKKFNELMLEIMSDTRYFNSISNLN
jgi:hypothetical protein